MRGFSKISSAHTEDRNPLDAQALLLQRFHLMLALVHLISGIAIASIGSTSFSLNVGIPVPASHAYNQSLIVQLEQLGQLGQLGQLEQIGELAQHGLVLRAPFDAGAQLQYLTSATLLISACEHAVYVVGFATYFDTASKHGVIVARWISYALSCSLMNMVIAACCNIQDVALLGLIWFLTTLMMIAGLKREQAFAQRLSHEAAAFDEIEVCSRCVGWSCFCVNWAAILAHFCVNSENAPWWVWVIVFAMLFLQALFGLVQETLSEAALRREYAYAVLSLVAKQVLAWVLYSGLRARPRVD